MHTHNQVLPISVNLHFWRPCNMRCGFCFATYEDTAQSFRRGYLPRESLRRLIDELAEHGARKMTFVGGEPTLCPWLGALITHAKRRGLTTMLVSNGWHLRKPDYMQTHLRDLDWLTLSVDSTDPQRNLRAGRAHRGVETMSVDELLQIGARARQMGLRLKLNTVVHAFNHDEDLGDFVSALSPERWKLFQVLPVEGQNDAEFANFQISFELFQAFVDRHARLAERNIEVVPEDNEDMRGTYAMIDHAAASTTRSRAGITTASRSSRSASRRLGRKFASRPIASSLAEATTRSTYRAIGSLGARANNPTPGGGLRNPGSLPMSPPPG